METHWLLPIDPAAHLEHQPADWRTRPDATEVWAAVGRSQPIGRWCLRSGYRTMRAGDVIWAYLSKRQEVCARGEVVAVVHEDHRAGDVHGVQAAARRVTQAEAEDDGRWFVEVAWDDDATSRLMRNPLSRRVFGQVPMSTCRANASTIVALEAHLASLGA